jgi:hypothetical protein
MSQSYANGIPDEYKCITVPNTENFHHLLSNCRLENDGNQLHIHIPKEDFNTLRELFHIMRLSGDIE